MKKVWSLIVLLGIMLLPIVNVNAAEGYFSAGDYLVDTQSYEHSIFTAGNNITSNSNVKGLAFIAGNSVKIAGTKSYVLGAGNTLSISSAVENDLFAAGSSVRVEKDAYIGKDAYIAAGDVTLLTGVNGNAFIAASVVNLSGVTINGDLHIAAGKLNIEDDVVVNGNLIVNRDIEMINGDKVNASNTIWYDNIKHATETNRDILKEELLDVLSLLFLGLILAMIFPKLFKKMEIKVDKLDEFCKTSLYGLAMLIAVPVLILLSFVLIVGIPLAVIMLALYIVSLMVSTLISSTVLGYNINKSFIKKENNIYLSIMIGIVLLKLIYFVPVVGPLVNFISFIYGLGFIYQLFKERNN